MERNEKNLSTEHLKQFSELGWKNPPDLRNLKHDFNQAKSAHEYQEQRVKKWLDTYHVRGHAKIKTPAGRSEVQPRVVRTQAEWRYPALTEPFLSTQDVFNVNPITAEDKEPAYHNQLVLNRQFNTYIDKVRFFEDYVRTAVDEGTVVVRVGWEHEEEEFEAEVPGVDEFGNYVLVKEKQTKVIKNHPTATVCRYTDIIIDPAARGDLTQAQFVIHRYETNLSELRKDGKYKNLDQIVLDSTDSLHDLDDDDVENMRGVHSFEDNPRKRLTAYEYWGYWDIDGSGMTKAIVATWVGDTLIELDHNPFPDQELPFVLVQYLPSRNSNYGEPDGALIEEQQKIIGAVTRGMVDIMARSANGQVATRKGVLDAPNKRKMEQGDNFEFNDGSPAEAFHMLTFAEIPQSAYLMLQNQNDQAESLTGVKAFSSGISGQALGETATGIRSALDATSKRELAILRRLAEGIKDIGKKFIAMNYDFLSPEEVIRITNEEFITVKRDGLEGDFDLELTISTAEVDAEKADKLAFILQTMDKANDPQLYKLVLSDIAKLYKMPDLAKMVQEMQPPPPDPMTVEMQKLELRKMEAEVVKIEAEALKQKAESIELNTQAELNAAKVNVEEANIAKIEAETKAINLGYVKDATGQTHAETVDLEKQKQANKAKQTNPNT